MATRLPDVLREAREKAIAEEIPLHVAEKQIQGVSHAEIGAYLLGVWGLPYALLQAVACHHEPSALSQSEFNVVTAVHVASALVESRMGDGGGSAAAQIDLAYLESVGVADRLPEWEALLDLEMNNVEGDAK